MQQLTTQKFQYIHFDSVNEVEELPITNHENNFIFESSVKRYRGGRELSWWGCSGGFETARKLVTHGWPEGLKKMEDLEKYLKPVPRLKTIRRRKIRSDFGDFVDMQQVYSGNLNRAWETTERRNGLNAQSPKVTILADSGIACSQHADELFWTGAATVVITDALQASGRDVEIIVYSDNTEIYKDGLSPNRKLISFTIKKFTQPMTPEFLIAAVALSGFQRYYGFRAMVTDPRPVNAFLGKPIKNSHELPLNVSEGSKVLRVSNLTSYEAASQFLQELRHTLTQEK